MRRPNFKRLEKQSKKSPRLANQKWKKKKKIGNQEIIRSTNVGHSHKYVGTSDPMRQTDGWIES